MNGEWILLRLIAESTDLKDYLKELEVVDFSNPLIKQIVTELFSEEQTEIEMVKTAFEYVRDKVSHSLDIQSTKVTCKASEVLKYKEGICYAKSNLLAALLRSQGIPTGFCYQRLMLFNTPGNGYCIHALNAVFLKTLHKWIRLDARGNKKGIDVQFSIEKEMVAYYPQEKFGEVDYPLIYVNPHPKTISVLEEHTDAIRMCNSYLPDKI